MPAPLHATLSSHQRRRLYELRREPTLNSRERDRVEALLLSADGMRVPQLARHFGCCEATVRRALNGMLSRKRTWTAAQLAEALAAEKGIVMKPRTVRKYLKLMGARYVRTKYVLRHRQDREAAAEAQEELDDLKKKPGPTAYGSSSSTKAASPSPSLPPTAGAAATTGPRCRTKTPGPARERDGGPGRPRCHADAAPDLVGGALQLEEQTPARLPALRLAFRATASRAWWSWTTPPSTRPG